MSKELDYRKYVAAYFGDVYGDVSKPVDAKAIAAKLGLKPNVINGLGELAIPESRFRAEISNRIGRVEELAHNTQKDPNTKTRVNQVPEANVTWNTRLQEEIYVALTPVDSTGNVE